MVNNALKDENGAVRLLCGVDPMTPVCRLLISCAALAALPAGQALAADYDPPIFVEEAPEWVPVEIGSGWYLRGDVSYNFADPVYHGSLLGSRTENTRFGGTVGVGYHFNDFFRGDITLGYLGGDRLRGRAGPEFASVSQQSWNGLVNAYADLGTFMGFTPYVGAGAGLTYSKHDVQIGAPSIPLSESWNRSQYNFSYALMAGGSYKVSENTSIDVGYQFLHTPDMTYYDPGTDSLRKGNKQHQLRVGLRYDLW